MPVTVRCNGDRRFTMRWRKPRSFCARFAPARSQRWCQKMPFRSRVCQCRDRAGRQPDPAAIASCGPYKASLIRSPPFAAPCANRRGRSPRASARHNHGKRRMYRRAGLPRGSEGALFGKASGIDALADFGDFAFWRVAMEQAHFNGGFARAGHFKAEFSPHRSTARKPW